MWRLCCKSCRFIISIRYKAINQGFGRLARAGSCALVCVIVNNTVYAANAGDSEGFIVTNNPETSKRVNHVLNANNAI